MQGPTRETKRSQTGVNRKDPPSSLWTKTAKNEDGATFQNNAWRVGRFWDEMKEKVDVFLENDGNRKLSESS